MLSYVVVLSALAASALGANSTTTPGLPAGFNIGLVKPDERNSWCLGQRNVCPSICKGSTKQNTCDPSTLQFNCVCSDGSTPDVSPYKMTVPFYVCEANYGQCIDAHPNDAMGQEACKNANKCGSKNATATHTSSSSSSPSSTSLSDSSSSTDTIETESTPSSSSSSSSSAKTTSNAAMPLGNMMETYSTGLMAGAMFMAMRLVL